MNIVNDSCWSRAGLGKEVTNGKESDGPFLSLAVPRAIQLSRPLTKPGLGATLVPLPPPELQQRIRVEDRHVQHRVWITMDKKPCLKGREREFQLHVIRSHVKQGGLCWLGRHI